MTFLKKTAGLPASGGLALVSLILAVATAIVAAAPVDVEPQVFVLDTGIRHQVMDNFGANDAWSMQKIGRWSEANKNKIAELLFSTNTGIGLSCWRFYFGAGLNHQTIRDDWRTAESFETTAGQYDWTRQPGARWFLRAAKARGVQQFAATVYSPPLRLTRNGLSNLGRDTNATTNLKPGAENAFAQYLSDILRHFRDNPNPAERIDFNFIFPVNEPQWDWQHGQEGCRAANGDLKTIFTALKSRLDADGVKTKILGPESGSIPDMYSPDVPAREKWHADYGDYLRFIGGDPALAACFSGIVTYHSYWSDDLAEQLVPRRERLGREMEKYPGWKIWQSEYCIMEPGRDLGMDSALRLARIIHCDLTLVNASAWQWWNAVANGDYKSGLIYTDYQQPGDAETIYESKLLWTLGNYSRFIRPGMYRVALVGRQDLTGLMASAFSAADSGRVVLVFDNLSTRPQQVQLRFKSAQSGQPAGNWFTTYTTSATENLAAGKKINAAESFRIPPRSVVTLVGGESPK